MTKSIIQKCGSIEQYIKFHLWNDSCIEIVFLQSKTNRLNQLLKKIKPVVRNHIEKGDKLVRTYRLI